MKFYDVLEELMQENQIDIPQLSKDTNIDDSNLYDYKNHGAIPNIDYAVTLANYFNVSLNYLMGLDEDKTKIPFKKTYNVKVFSKRYDKLLKDNKLNHSKICSKTKLNYSSHYAWQHGSTPATKSLIIIADYLGVSIDYLIGRTD